MNWQSEWQYIDKFSKQVMLSIPIKDNWPRQVEAWQVGDLAVHENIMYHNIYGMKWQISHVPTLASFIKAVPLLEDHSKERLLSWCHRVQLKHRDLWAELRNYDSNNYQEISNSTLDKIRNWCLSVEI
jgi:hypothetical protein